MPWGQLTIGVECRTTEWDANDYGIVNVSVFLNNCWIHFPVLMRGPKTVGPGQASDKADDVFFTLETMIKRHNFEVEQGYRSWNEYIYYTLDKATRWNESVPKAVLTLWNVDNTDGGSTLSHFSMTNATKPPEGYTSAPHLKPKNLLHPNAGGYFGPRAVPGTTPGSESTTEFAPPGQTPIPVPQTAQRVPRTTYNPAEWKSSPGSVSVPHAPPANPKSPVPKPTMPGLPSFEGGEKKSHDYDTRTSFLRYKDVNPVSSKPTPVPPVGSPNVSGTGPRPTGPVPPDPARPGPQIPRHLRGSSPPPQEQPGEHGEENGEDDEHEDRFHSGESHTFQGYLMCYRYGDGSIRNGNIDFSIISEDQRGSFSISVMDSIPFTRLLAEVRNNIDNLGYATSAIPSGILIRSRSPLLSISIDQVIDARASGLDHYMIGYAYPPLMKHIHLYSWTEFIHEQLAAGARFMAEPIPPNLYYPDYLSINKGERVDKLKPQSGGN